ncbi:MAG TPA: hypothetical protein VLL52_06275 [Anaerolineae bacterium]|nr:hypothetical protein [Anaerolineae bacterium]
MMSESPTSPSQNPTPPPPPPTSPPTDSPRQPTRQRRAAVARYRTWLEAQASLSWAIIIILTALLGTIYLNQASQAATIGRTIQIKQFELEDLKRTNATLEQEIAAAQTLDRLQDEAQSLGFIPANPQSIEYLIVTDYPALTPQNQATPTPVPPPVETMHEAIWLTLKTSLSNLVRGEYSE